MIYGTDELLHQAKLNAEAPKPSGFLYGTDAATKVGKPACGPRPNNVLWLEEKTLVIPLVMFAYHRESYRESDADWTT